ncbi:MAG TPA: type III-A CRISPR-associated RAMP protein Csm3, partial [Bacilli bacterium]|nr:type III-A CRISPR-associated RAMP protein Csm3 [Bacilli bacterium]
VYRQGEQNNPLSRVIFRDLELTKESKEELSKALDGEYTEIKAENTIDRARGTAKSPRFIERVPAGAVFEGEYIVQYLDTDQDNDFEELVKKGFKLLENNYLGGSGSRGYGKVEFEIINQEEL